MPNKRPDIPYKFHTNLVMRTPIMSFPFSFGKDMILSLINDPVFLEALYLASPNLYTKCQLLKNQKKLPEKESKKLTFALSKYYLRMCTRATPFGLFAGCTTASWKGSQDQVTIANGQQQRRTRLDMLYLCALAKHISEIPVIKPLLKFYPNSSLYTIGNEYRFVETIYQNTKRNYNLSAVENDDYVAIAINKAEQGATLMEITSTLLAHLNDDTDESEALAFIEAMADAQVIVSELEPKVTGPDYCTHLLEFLQAKQNVANDPAVESLITALQKTQLRLTQLDLQLGNPIQKYLEVQEILKPIGIQFDESRLFQTDLAIEAPNATLSLDTQKKLESALAVLNKLCSPLYSPSLNTFVKRYEERYGEQEMPLLEVLDAETGIGYPENISATTSPLLKGLDIHHPEKMVRQIVTDEIQQWKNDKLYEALRDGAYEVNISEEEVSKFNTNWLDLPPSFSILFKYIGSPNQCLQIENVGGSSATNLLGRFCHYSEAIQKITENIIAEETKANPEVRMAEISHLPEERLGNVICRPLLREFEIAYLANSGMGHEQQIRPQDLLLRIESGYVYLIDIKSGKRVMPRMANAHNFKKSTLPVYRFLCDLQIQSMRSNLAYQWDAKTNNWSFLPRATYNGVVLFPATWHIKTSAITTIIAQNNVAEFIQFCKKQRIPQRFLLTDGDNDLLVDLDNPLTVQTFLDAVKRREQFKIKEFIWSKDTAIQNNRGEVYTNQFIASLICNHACYKGLKNEPAVKQVTSQSSVHYSPGSEWLYYKIYLGVKSVDKVLEEGVSPLVNQLKAKQYIKQWFFIRYRDPEPHLRIRFRLAKNEFLGPVMTAFYAMAQPYEQANIIWRVQIDTYQREIARYGHNTIEIAEEIFYHDSEMACQLLSTTWGDEREAQRWLWALKSVDGMLDSFSISLEEKATLMLQIKTSFVEEFDVSKTLKLSIDKRYRANSAVIMQVLQGRQAGFEEVEKLINARNQAINRTVGQLLAAKSKGALKTSFTNLIASYAHLNINRILATAHREHELLIYDFLHRAYRSQLAMNKRKSNDAPKKIVLPRINPKEQTSLRS